MRIREQTLLSEENCIRDELLKTEIRAQVLRAKLRNNLDQRVDDPQAERIIQEVIAVEQSKCLSLCEAMQRWLPRELRDMVYEHILGPAAWHNNNHTTLVAGWGYPRLICNNRIAIEVGEPDYIGHETRQELAEYWYKRTTFDFGKDLGLIKAFLERKALGTGRLALDLVRQLEITVDCNDGIGAEKEESLTKSLAGLALLARPARLRINLYDTVGVTRYNDDRFILMLQKVRQLLPNLPGWTIEFVVLMVTNDHVSQESDDEEAWDDVVPFYDDEAPGYQVHLMIPGTAETSLNGWSNKYKQASGGLIMSQVYQLTLITQLREELEQYYDGTLNECDETDEADDDCVEDDSGDDEHGEYSRLGRDELLELEKEVWWCKNGNSSSETSSQADAAS